MLIRGLQKTSLVDYPGEICTTIFVGGCNLQCRYCFNGDLVVGAVSVSLIPGAEVLDFLKKRASLVEAVCITGGEPTLQKGLLNFLGDLRRLKLKIKLDTNGTRPEIVRRVLSEGLADYMAVDIKAPFAKYPAITGATWRDVENIRQTVNLLREGGLEHEFRTTVVPVLLDEEDIVDIAKTLAGCRRYFLQQFRPGPNLLDPALSNLKPYPPEKMKQMADLCSPYIADVQLRGC